MRRSRYLNERGYVLAVVLGLLGVLFILAMSLGTAVRNDLAQARRFQDTTAAEFLARGGIAWVMHYLNDLERRDLLWQAPWRLQSGPFHARALGAGTFDVVYVDANGKQRYGFRDEGARLHLNRAPEAALAALPGFTAATAAAIVARRQQQPWPAPEALVGSGTVPASAFHGTAQAQGVAPYLTVWGSGKVNVNTAPPQVLGTLPGLPPSYVEALVRYRQGDDGLDGTADDRHFHTVADMQEVPGLPRAVLERLQPFLTVEPSVFRVEVIGRVRGQLGREQRHRQVAIIDRSVRPMRLHSWRRPY